MAELAYAFFIVLVSSVVIDKRMTNAVVTEHRFTGLRRNGLKLRNETTDHQITVNDVSLCAIKCIKTSNCRTISWNMGSKTCLLSSTDVTHGEWADDALEGNVDWNTMSLMEYTVFGLAFSYEEVTFEDAVNRCIEQSTVIAGPDDLLYSHGLGYGYNKCCWLADRSVGYVLKGNAGIIDCDDMSSPEVICVLN